MKTLKLLLPAGIALVGLVVGSSVSYGKPEFTKKEKKACTTCHVKSGAKELNETGKYYQEHKTLEKK